MAKRVLFVLGASGVGKTAALERLAAAPGFDGSCHFFDSMGVPSTEVMERDFGGGEGWQRHATARWVERLLAVPDDLAILEGQTRPTFVRDAAASCGLERWEAVLLDCAPGVRQHRLATLRQQPELVSAEMEQWAAYLRGQADALGLVVVDTSEVSIDEVATRLRTLGERL